jgi:peroxiredoxin
MITRRPRAGSLLLAANCEGSTAGGGGRSAGLPEHLLGEPAPEIKLPFAPGKTDVGAMVSLADLARRHSLVVSFYPNLAPMGSEIEMESAEVEVGRVRARGWSDYEPELAELGYRVVGVSAQSPEVQAEFAVDWLLGYTLLNDSDLLLASELGLSTRTGARGERAYEALTMLIREGRISRVFDPAACRECDAAIVTASIRERGA